MTAISPPSIASSRATAAESDVPRSQVALFPVLRNRTDHVVR